MLRRNDLKIGEDVTETLELIPLQWKVIQHVREKFSCRACEAITQPPAPSQPITQVKSQRTPTPFSRPRTTPLMEPVSAGRNWWRGHGRSELPGPDVAGEVLEHVVGQAPTDELKSVCQSWLGAVVD